MSDSLVTPSPDEPKRIELDAAIDCVARHAIAGMVQNATEWAFYPEVGEHDWLKVDQRMQELGAFPDPVEFAAAYALLESRADTRG